MQQSHLLLATAHLAKSTFSQYLPAGLVPSTQMALQWLPHPGGLCRAQITIPPAILASTEHILPSFSCPQSWGFRFSLHFCSGTNPTGQVCQLEPIGRFTQRQTFATEQNPVKGDIDFFQVAAPLSAATLRLDVEAPLGQLQQTPSLMTLSLSGPAPKTPPTTMDLPSRATFIVPAKSQMRQDPALAHRICSPTSVSMVLDYFGCCTEPMDVAAQAHHAALDLYGVWPANINAATHWGLGGYLLRFPHWDAARYLLAKGVPIIASVHYRAGELSNAAAAHTGGHLLVLRGYGPDWIEVNDPAAQSDAKVHRRYDLKQFIQVWLERAAVGYVLFPLQT